MADEVAPPRGRDRCGKHAGTHDRRLARRQHRRARHGRRAARGRTSARRIGRGARGRRHRPGRARRRARPRRRRPSRCTRAGPTRSTRCGRPRGASRCDHRPWDRGRRHAPTPTWSISTVPKGVADHLRPAVASRIGAVRRDLRPVADAARRQRPRRPAYPIVSGLDLLLFQALLASSARSPGSSRRFRRCELGARSSARVAAGTAAATRPTIFVARVRRMSPDDPLSARVATPADVDAVVATITTAFFDDPLWGPAFPDSARRAAQAERMWRLFVTSSMRYPWMLVTDPVRVGGDVDPARRQRADPGRGGRLRGLHDRRRRPREITDGILRIFEALDARAPARAALLPEPVRAPTTRTAARVSGMDLLRESLARIDATGMPAYLESTQSGEPEAVRERRVQERDRLTVPSGAVVTTMWRPPTI